MDKRTEQAFAYLEKNEHSMMELLKNLVSIETPSADREANERIAAHLDTLRRLARRLPRGPGRRKRSRFFCLGIWIQFMRLESSARNRFL